jgi:protein O-mannosyl-transferase
MKKNKQNIKFALIFLLFSLIIASIYSNTLQSSWHLDDGPNILDNYFLHLDSLSFNKLKNTLYTDVHDPVKLGKKLYRPVPCLTFALNWYFGKDNVLGYHIVNISIHILTTFFLFLFITNLFHTPNLKSHNTINPVIISFLASLLWAANPMQTQTVTYIVQRMAQLAALFYIIGMYTYIKARLCKSPVKSYILYLLTLAVYPLAIYSKSNAVMLPMAILLVEIIFFQSPGNKKYNKKLLLCSAGIILFIILFATFFFLKGNPLSFLDSYNHRSFTFIQRLLTEPRVVVFYLSQIFFPLPDRFSIAHDIVLSSSLISPWVTLPCILLIILIISFALIQIKKRPLLSFAILFFFLNHIIESSVIALEIIFEHRNYLPSFFLFLPLSYIIIDMISKNWNKKKISCMITTCLVLLTVFCFSISSYIRNKAWKNDITLWTDAVSKAPNNARAINVLAIKLAWGKESSHPKRYDMAIKLLETSLDKHIPTKSVKAGILSNMGAIYFYNKNNHKKAVTLYEQALHISPINLKIRKDFVGILIIMRNFDEALKHVNILINNNNKNGTYYNLKGLILLWKKQYIDSLLYFQEADKLVSDKMTDKINILFNTSVALSLSGEYKKAELLILDALKNAPKNITWNFVLIENSIRAEDDSKINIYTETMFKEFDKKQIRYGLENFTDNPMLAPISITLIEPVIKKYLKNGER